MSDRFNNRVKVAITTYLLLITIIYVKKPHCMFDENNKMKEFGVDKEQTIFPFPLCVIVLSIFIYYILGMICLQCTSC